MCYHSGMNYRLVVFDFDGTLVDSMADSIRIFQQIGPDLGLKPFHDLEAARHTPTRKLLKEVGVTFWKMPKVVRAFRSAVAEHAHELKLHLGIADALARLHGGGIRLGILSSNDEANIRRCLGANGVEHHFSFIVGHPQLFGKARALRRIRKRERIEREQMVYVGDETRDVDAARRAGIISGAVAWGYHAPELLERTSPTVFFRVPDDLAKLAS